MEYPIVHPEAFRSFIDNHIPCSARFTFPVTGQVTHYVFDGMVLWEIDEEGSRSPVRFPPDLVRVSRDPECLSRDASFELLRDRLTEERPTGIFWATAKLVRRGDDLYDAYDKVGNLLYTVTPESAGRIMDSVHLKIEVVEPWKDEPG